MTLDLAAITRQIDAMAQTSPWQTPGDGLTHALAAFDETDPVALQERIEAARTSWLVARLYATLTDRFACPPLPPAWAVLATDGSSITPERHSPIHFFVFNVGLVQIQYGTAPAAMISHRPRLYFRPDETHLTLADGVRRLPIDGTRLAARRTVVELEALAELATDSSPALPTVALQDGSLLLWSIQSEEEAVQRWLLDDYLAAADRLRRAGQPLAGYISAPASTDVVHALQVSVCPHVPIEMATINCDQCPSRRRPTGPACSVIPVPPLTDRWLFEQRLAPGERSDLFTSQSKIQERYRRHDPAHEIMFFYLHTGTEVARIEIPLWVAEQPDLVDLVHVAIVDQAQRGQGYPTALQEAHEAAVIHADERRLVERLVDTAMARAGVTMRRSGKDTSKRIRGL